MRFLIPALVCVFIMITSCILQLTYKNFYELNDDSTSNDVVKLWGEPDNVRVYQTEWGEQTLYVYSCLRSVSCAESDCSFGAPCYFLLFDESGELLSTYDASY